MIASIGKGVLVFAGVSKDDTLEDSTKTASKVLKCKLWDDEQGGRVCIPTAGGPTHTDPLDSGREALWT